MKQKRKRSRVLALLALLCLGVGCGVPPAQESGEESRIAPTEDSRSAAVEEWKGPEIIHCRIPENGDKRLEIEVALYEEGLDEGYRFSAFKELKVTCIEPEADTWSVRYEARVQTEGGNGQWQIQLDFFRDHTALVGCSGTEYYMALQKDTVAFHSIWDVWAGCLEEGVVVRARVRGFENRPRPI